MPTSRSFRSTSYAPDHFVPEVAIDPQTQRRLRGQLEQIDYTAFAANREVIASTLDSICADKFQHLALAAATARVRWVAAALAASEQGATTPAEITKLAALRSDYEELGEAYEALRRMVERGYLPYRTGVAATPRKA